MPREFMPILRHPDFRLPWAVIAPHEAQAQRNHYQSLEQLAGRGGLSFTEAFCVLTDTNWSEVAHTEPNEQRARERVSGMVEAHQRAHGVPAPDEARPLWCNKKTADGWFCSLRPGHEGACNKHPAGAPEACSKVIDGLACTMPKGHRCPDCSGNGDGVGEVSRG